ncbi:MAG: PEP-CTERM sorting domain-containing protein [Verrucomicrobiales bacterium]
MTKFLIFSTLSSFAIAEAGAALTLVIDTSTKTAIWSGIATSGVITSPQFQLIKVAVGTAPTANPTAENPAVTTTDAALTPVITSIGTGGPGATAGENPGRIHVNAVEGSLQTLVAEILDFTGGGTTTVELTGDGVAYSYTQLEPAQVAAFEALDGTELRFRDGNTLAGADYGSAGFISVVPEPGSAALLGLGLAALLVRRRR